MTLKNPAQYDDVEVKVHLATEDYEAVPLVQLKSLVTSALTYKGPIGLTSPAPSQPEIGDVYVFDTAGSATWLPGSPSVTLHEAVFYDGTNWDLMGSSTTGGAYVVEVKEKTGNAVKVDSTDPANPIVTVDLTDVESQLNAIDTKADNNKSKIEAQAVSITNNSKELTNLQNQIVTNDNDIAANVTQIKQLQADVAKQLVVDQHIDNTVAVVNDLVKPATATKLGTVKIPANSGLEIDASGNLKTKFDAALVAENASHIQDLLTEFNAQHLTVQLLRHDVDKNTADLKTLEADYKAADVNVIMGIGTQLGDNQRDITSLLSRVTALEAKP